jgi:hypothetical protein
MLCSLVKVNQRFGGTLLPSSWMKKSKPSKKPAGRRQSSAFCLLHAGLLLGLLFDPEDGGNMFF